MDTTIEDILRAIALEMDDEEHNILIMRDQHIPGLEEIILPYLPIVKLYILDDNIENTDLSIDAIAAGIIWQRCKRGVNPWSLSCMMSMQPTNHER